MSKRRGADIRIDLTDLINENLGFESAFVADKILPPVKVDQISGNIPILEAGIMDKNGILSTDRAENGTYNRGRLTLSDDSYTTITRGFEMTEDLVYDVPVYDLLDLGKENVKTAKQAVLLAKESRVAATVFNTTTFAAADDNQAAGAHWTIAGTNTLTAVEAAGDKLYKKTKVSLDQATLFINKAIANALFKNTDLRSQIQYTEAMVRLPYEAKVQLLTQYYGVKEVVVLDVGANLTGFNLATQFANIYKSQLGMLAYVSTNSPNNWGFGLGRQPEYRKATQGKQYLVEEYDTEESDTHVKRVKHNSGEKIFKKYGVLLTGLSA